MLRSHLWGDPSDENIRLTNLSSLTALKNVYVLTPPQTATKSLYLSSQHAFKPTSCLDG